VEVVAVAAEVLASEVVEVVAVEVAEAVEALALVRVVEAPA
jgi:hypothetical protein